MTNIEPTEEQREAALRFCKDHSVCGNGWLVDEFTVAELLAEREAKLREEVARLSSTLALSQDAARLSSYLVAAQRAEDERDAAQAELKTERLVAEKALAARNDMENERDAARRDLKQSKAMTDAARGTLVARVAELEASRDRLIEESYDETYALRSALAREAQHLADIKALNQFLGDHETEGGIWIPCTEYDVMPNLAGRLAHYADAKADAPASTEGGEG